MKPKESKPETVYRIFDAENGSLQGSYSRACCTEYDFESINDARTSNCHDLYKNKAKYKIAKYKVTYELIEDDVDPASEQEKADFEKEKAEKLALEKEMDDLGLVGWSERMAFAFDRIREKFFREAYLTMANRTEESV